MLLNKITIDNFKGCRHGEYEFGGKNARLSGKNGIGKSTIVDAWTWLWWDKDNQLISNPNIRPADEIDVMYEPSVTCDIVVNGKQIQAKKSQKKKVSKDGKISLSNNYEINSVPKTERDFKSYFEELGIELTQMLQLSHPEVFVAGMNEKKSREQMRNTLFKMSGNISDYDVAKQTEGISDLMMLLDNYTVEEIQKIQAATIRKIKDEYGSDGEIIDAQIQGKESLRVDIDVSDLELQKKALLEQIENKRKSLIDVDKQFSEYQELSNGILELKFKLADMERNANADFLKKKSDHDSELRKLELEISSKRTELSRRESEKRNSEVLLLAKEKLLESKKEEYRAVYAECLNEDSLLCPTCGQAFPEDKAEKIKADFESNKKYRINQIIAAGNDAKEQVGINKDIIEKSSRMIVELKNLITELETKLEDMKSVEIKNDIDITLTDEYQKIEKMISEKEKSLHAGNNADEIRRNITMEIDSLHYQLREVEKKMSSVDIDSRIDEQVAELQHKKLELAQEKANCEKILYQIDLLNRSKNELLTEEINSHFEMVEWVLFKVLKNGSYEDACIPTYKGKVLGESTNTALSLNLKIDIIKGLQKFYGKNYPVFIDGAECLDTVNANNVKTDFQVIMLKVSDDKKLKVEVM